jgi:predicted secreted protein
VAFFRGEEGSISFKDSSGVVAAVSSTRSWSFTINKDTLDVTDQGSTSREFIGSLLSGSGSAEVMYTAPGSGETLNFIDDVLTTKDQTDAQFELFLDFTGIITSADYSATVGELEVITVNFISSGAITASI